MAKELFQGFSLTTPLTNEVLFLPSRNITVIIFIPLSFLFPLSNPHYCRSTKQLNLHDYTIVKHNRQSLKLYIQ